MRHEVRLLFGLFAIALALPGGAEDGNAAAIRSPIPILWVVGKEDPATRPSDYAFEKAPPHPKSKYLTMDAGHLELPAVAADQVLSWLRSLD